MPRADSTVQVPVQFLEHSRLAPARPPKQSAARARARASRATCSRARRRRGAKGAGGNDEGGYQFVLELKIDDIVDWLWEELKLPDLKPKTGAVQQRGLRARRLGQARRALAARPPPHPEGSDQAPRDPARCAARSRTTTCASASSRCASGPRPRPSCYFALDVSASMTERDRKLAKTFFFLALQGLRRQYTHVEPVFVAHTVEAWEFAEPSSSRSAAAAARSRRRRFASSLDIAAQRYDPSRFNTYVFYASDGENFRHDRDAAQAALAELGELVNYVGYVETASAAQQALQYRDGGAVRAARGRNRRRGPPCALVAGIRLGRDPRVLQPAGARGGRGRGANRCCKLRRPARDARAGRAASTITRWSSRTCRRAS